MNCRNYFLKASKLSKWLSIKFEHISRNIALPSSFVPLPKAREGCEVSQAVQLSPRNTKQLYQKRQTEAGEYANWPVCGSHYFQEADAIFEGVYRMVKGISTACKF